MATALSFSQLGRGLCEHFRLRGRHLSGCYVDGKNPQGGVASNVRHRLGLSFEKQGRSTWGYSSVYRLNAGRANKLELLRFASLLYQSPVLPNDIIMQNIYKFLFNYAYEQRRNHLFSHFPQRYIFQTMH